MSSKKRRRLVITCEHGGAHVPAAYKKLFKNREGLLQSHRGFDRGALRIAKDLAKALDAQLFYSTVSRLVVDLNRSLYQSDLHWSGLKSLSKEQKQRIVNDHWLPHREKVLSAVARDLKKGGVIHIGAHSFTPRLNGHTRKADIGILFDPSRPNEAAFALSWIQNLKAEFPNLNIQKNSPYKGTSDGFTTTLRELSKSYMGIELEINQKHLVKGQFRVQFRQAIVKSLKKALTETRQI